MLFTYKNDVKNGVGLEHQIIKSYTKIEFGVKNRVALETILMSSFLGESLRIFGCQA